MILAFQSCILRFVIWLVVAFRSRDNRAVWVLRLLPETKGNATTANIFCVLEAPQDALQTREKRYRLSLDRNQSRGGQTLQNTPSVAASWCISGTSDKKKLFVIFVSPWIVGQPQGPRCHGEGGPRARNKCQNSHRAWE